MSTLTYSLTLTALAVCVFALALAVRQVTEYRARVALLVGKVAERESWVNYWHGRYQTAQSVMRCIAQDEAIVIGFVRDLLNAYATDINIRLTVLAVA